MSLLFDAFDELKRTNIATRLIYKKVDSTKRIYALRIELPMQSPKDFFLVAKSYFFESNGRRLVSVNVDLVLLAQKLMLPIKMFVAETGKFYDFDPTYILTHGFTNERDGNKFVNWEVKE